MSEIEWGTAGEWAAAIGSLVLVGWTMFLWQSERRQRARDEASRRAHAFNAWIDGDTMYAMNVGPEPITDWHVATCSSWPCRHAPGKHDQQTLMSDRTHGVVTPGRTVDAPVLALHKELPEDAGLPPAIVGFIDWSGHYWTKDGPTLELVRVDDQLDRRKATET